MALSRYGISCLFVNSGLIFQYYRLFINWTNEKIKRTFVERNMFDFKHIKPLDKGYEEMPGAMVLFSTPGEVFEMH